MQNLTVKVLGGSFIVSDVLLGTGESSEKVLAILTTTPEDRWFVMISDEVESQRDALAFIDDKMEFQVVAYGVLKQD